MMNFVIQIYHGLASGLHAQNQLYCYHMLSQSQIFPLRNNGLPVSSCASADNGLLSYVVRETVPVRHLPAGVG